MTSAATLSEEARREVKRLVLLSRLAGVVVALALASGSLVIHRGHLSSLASISQLATVVVGLGSFVTLSTLTRIGHARVLERSLDEVQHLTEQLRALADRDPLTGLYNMRAFYNALDSALVLARTTGGEVSVVVADLDNFKTLNDSFGHRFGDRVLIETAAVFARSGGPGTVAARLGGDEFALLLAGTSRAEAVEMARGVEDTLSGVKIDDRQPAMLGSFGIGTYPGDGETAQLLFAAADSRMYSEKHSRKSGLRSAVSVASWRLFVRAGRALYPGREQQEILHDIAAAAREEFALKACIIKLDSGEPAGAVTAVVAVDDPALEAPLARLAERGPLDAAAIAGEMPNDAWLVGQPIGASSGVGGVILLAGQPPTSFRPDAAVVVALADLILNVVAERPVWSDAPDDVDIARAA